ncbi:MAG: hypothetical protein GWN58_38390, partial [Anaerolineae bacterium]|nr:hypothetical protein [Anaerolineae bacterium]
VPKAPRAETPAGIETPDESTGAPDGTGTYKTAWVDMAQLLEQETDLDFESTTILRDRSTPHLVFHLPDRTWEMPLAG